ncbi:hypothetical protein M5K25_010437 [Dendrobium thyrsiflorum]|uniref:Uncharacterized protein n=1 Tax=Dendrobium thyrsiflorum TaxID=117978 RepID=A0ABD0V144_DENTH
MICLPFLVTGGGVFDMIVTRMYFPSQVFYFGRSITSLGLVLVVKLDSRILEGGCVQRFDKVCWMLAYTFCLGLILKTGDYGDSAWPSGILVIGEKEEKNFINTPSEVKIIRSNIALNLVC